MRHTTKGRVHGPYRNRDGFRVVVTTRDGERAARVFASEAAALEFRAEVEAGLAREEVTVTDALDRYQQHLAAKGLRPRSVAATRGRLRSMLTDLDELLGGITPRRAQGLYDTLVDRGVAVDTHRNTLAEAGTFARWAVKRGMMPLDPFAAVEAVGRRKRGKPQLRLDEARRLLDTAIPAAQGGDRGALVTALILLTGLRASEAAELRQRDVDDGGRLLWVSEAKTEAGIRRMEVPDPLIEPLLAAAGAGEIFPGNRYWVRRQVARLCRLAGVPVVCPHGLRGTHSTLAQDHGATSQVVAAALGHTSHVVTERHYTAPGTVDRARARRAALKLLPGGRA